VDDHGDHAHIFVSNVLNGTVSRLDVAVGAKGLTLLKETAIAAGYTHVPNAGAVVLGPTGLAFDRGTDSLYVARPRTTRSMSSPTQAAARAP